MTTAKEERDWYGFDFDGTLAYFLPGDYLRYGATVFGEPILPTVALAKEHIREGHRVKILTARVSDIILLYSMDHALLQKEIEIRDALNAWCVEHIGQRVELTNQKDGFMRLLFDDKALGVQSNTGRVCHCIEVN